MKPAWLRCVKMPLLYRFVLFITWCMFKIFYRHKVYGQKHFNKGDAIIASNHVSYIDPPIIAISSPEEIHFLARQTLFRNPLFGTFIRNLNAHPVSGAASDIAVFKTIGEILKKGQKVLLFPEGRRSVNNKLGEIKPGIALLALRYETSIIPAYIDGAYEAWPRGKKLPKFFARTRCAFGSPINIKKYLDQDKKLAQKLLSEEIKEKILSLKGWLESGAKGNPP